MYGKVLVPIDISHTDQAQNMIRTARQLGGADTKIVLLNVIDELPSYVAAQMPGGYVEKAQKAAQEELDKIAKQAGGKLETAIHVGYPSSKILEIANSSGADAIILASHRPGLEDYFIGSTAARVVRHAKCSVIVMR